MGRKVHAASHWEGDTLASWQGRQVALGEFLAASASLARVQGTPGRAGFVGSVRASALGLRRVPIIELVERSNSESLRKVASNSTSVSVRANGVDIKMSLGMM